MPTVSVDDVNIQFPYDPYECQIDYMRKVVESLSKSKHAVLESPTGTGKTLCLLCSSLAWLDKMQSSSELFSFDEASFKKTGSLVNENFPVRKRGSSCIPKIVFASRTHSQLSQAVNALKTTVYSNRSISVVGSRDQLCLHPEVLSLDSNSAKVYACRMRVKTRTCEYFRTFDLKRDDIMNNLKAEGIVDIEDLSNYGQKIRCCPYFMSREMKTDSPLIFMPYNYLLDPKIRTLYNITLENTAVIFDEAHNIEQVCEDASSVELTSALLAAAIEHVRSVCEVVFQHQMENELNSEESEVERPYSGSAGVTSLRQTSFFDVTQSNETSIESLNIEKMLTLKGQLIELEKLIDELEVPADGLTKEGSFMFDLLGRAGFNQWTKQTAQTVIEQILTFTNSAQNTKVRRTKGLSEMGEFLNTVFGFQSEEFKSSFSFQTQFKLQYKYAQYYRVHIKDDLLVSHLKEYGANVWDKREATSRQGNFKSRRISYWCFSPGRAIHELLKQNVRCIILTSGTIFPIEPLEAELKVKFDIALQNPHVINNDQLYLSAIPCGPNGCTLNASYSSRETDSYRSSLGLLLVKLAQTVPAGLLVFFPSYSFMSQCVQFWKDTDTFTHLLEMKQVYIEPKAKQEFIKIFNDYCHTATTNPKGATLFAVMRGRVSEGLDLSDNTGRAVAIVGLPYAPFHDPKVRLKMAYLDEQNVNHASRSEPSVKTSHPTGRQWYNTQAWRTVNQAIGRIIRHHLDYGAVFLCDERFTSNQAQSNLATWMRPNRQVWSDVESGLRSVTVFFQTMAVKYPLPNKLDSMAKTKATSQICTLGHLIPDRATLSKQRLSGFSSTNVQPANQPIIFAQKIGISTCNGDQLLADYTLSSDQLVTSKLEANLEPDHNCSSIFNIVYADNENRERSDSLRTLHGNNNKQDEQLERKILRHSSKKIRLTNSPVKSVLTSGSNESAITTYMSTLKAVIKDIADKNVLNELKQVIVKYKTTLTEDKHLPSSSTSSVDRFFTQLARILLPLDSPQLLRDAICLTNAEDRSRYADLCENITGMSMKRENLNQTNATTSQYSPSKIRQSRNDVMVCAKCFANPAYIPLISVKCKHIACFRCWRSIIEQGDRRCPSCQGPIRKRDLAKLTVSDKPTQ